MLGWIVLIVVMIVVLAYAWRRQRRRRRLTGAAAAIPTAPHQPAPTLSVDETAAAPRKRPTPKTLRARRAAEDVIIKEIDHPIQVDYTDAEGETSERQVKVKRISRGPSALYFDTYCLLAKGPRRLRADRIASLVDGETGEVFDDAERWLAQFLAARKSE